MISPTYLAHSAWEAAYLYAHGVPFIEARQQVNGHVVFAFDNETDRAWELGREWRQDACTPVNPTIFAHAYKTMNAILRSTPKTGAATDARPTTA